MRLQLICNLIMAMNTIYIVIAYHYWVVIYHHVNLPPRNLSPGAVNSAVCFRIGVLSHIFNCMNPSMNIIYNIIAYLHWVVIYHPWIWISH